VHDLGGPVGVRFALDHPGCVRSLALLNTLLHLDDVTEMLAEFARGLRTPGTRERLTNDAALERVLRLGTADGSSVTAEAIAGMVEPFGSDADRLALAKAGSGLGDAAFARLAGDLPGLKLPVRVIYGEQDRILVAVAETVARIRRDVPRAEVTALPDAGHFLQEDDPGRVGELLAEFFARQALPAGSHSTARGYLLAGHRSELERLQLQSRVWEPAGGTLLERLGDGASGRVLDVGCGAIGWLRMLGRWVGKGGEVVGTDVDANVLQATRAFVETEQLSNVSVIEDDLFASRLEPASFDAVHARFQLAPLGRVGEQLASYRRLVRPGGVIVLEDPDASSWHFNPPADSAKRLIALILEAFKAAGGDFNAGRRTTTPSPAPAAPARPPPPPRARTWPPAPTPTAARSQRSPERPPRRFDRKRSSLT
jgi:SAM-dependent methyltransferase